VALLAAGVAGCGEPGAEEASDRDPDAEAVDGATGGAAAGSPAPTGTAGDWPHYGGTPGAVRYSRLADVDTATVERLRRAWSYRTGVEGIFEATPVVRDGAMFLSTPVSGGRQRVIRLDAATGEPAWEAELRVDAGRAEPTAASRGVAVHRGRVYVGTVDARLVALDAATGEVEWEVRTADPARGYQHKQAPLASGGRVYTGVSGGPLGIRGWVKAFDARTGDELWTWHSIPSPAEGGWWGEWRETLPGTSVGLGRDIARERADSARFADAWRRGGGAVWMTPTLDTIRDLLLVGVGNPAPELEGRTRPGDNRWTSSVCAIRAGSGERAWCRQYLPHDVWGMDAASPPFLFSAGETPAVGHFSKLGLFYAWHRETGERLALSDPYVPHENFLARPTREGVVMAPGIYGGTEWSPAAWSPRTGLAYAASLHAPGRYFVRSGGDSPADPPRDVGFSLAPPGERYGILVAMDPATGRAAWTARTPRPLVGGVLATRGGLVFAGRLSGALTAWDARTGEELWSGPTDHGCASGPVTYRAGGRQFVAVACGGHFLGGGRGDQVVAFALPPGE
jgi:PQQ-dependent dehydrogenase (methanol/ethanol family)